MADKKQKIDPMVKCICIEPCQVRHWATGKIYFFRPDEEFAFPKCPPHFSPINDMAIDFDTATESLLMQSTSWNVTDAIEYVESLGAQYHGQKMSKENWVEFVIETRDRHVNIPSIPKVPSV